MAGGFTTTQRNVSEPPQPGHAKPSTRNTRANRSLRLGRSPASRMRGCPLSRFARRALAAAAVTALPVKRRELAPLVTGFGAFGIASLGLATAADGFAYAEVPTALGCSAASSTQR